MDARQAPVLVAAVDMGYGHLRAALPLVEALGAELVEVDRPPVARSDEERSWALARAFYERSSRGMDLPLVGPLLARAHEQLTGIEHLHPYRDLSRPDATTRALARLVAGGLGRGLGEHAERRGASVLATFFTPALSADVHSHVPTWCVVTDSDIARVWAPADPSASRVRYLAPSTRSVRRLVAYGVPRERVVCTGFPLPTALLGGPDLPALKRNLAARLVRLDASGLLRELRRHEIETALGPLPLDEAGRPPHLVFAVGGAGAQAELAPAFMPGLAPLIREGRLRLTLVAGTRHGVAATFEKSLARSGLTSRHVQILHRDDFRSAYAAFNDVLADADVLWTKPSELTFYGALGLPLVLGPPVGRHERYNRRWARELGAGLKQRDPRHAAQWLTEWLEDGVLAAAAWAGHVMMPASGTYRIAEAVRAGTSASAGSASRSETATFQ